MSTSIIILDQNFNANYVDIMVFEPSATVWGGGGIEHMVQKNLSKLLQNLFFVTKSPTKK